MSPCLRIRRYHIQLEPTFDVSDQRLLSYFNSADVHVRWVAFG